MVSIILGYTAGSLGKQFPVFQDIVVVSPQRSKCFNIGTLKNETNIPAQNVGNQQPSDVALYPSTTERSATLLQQPKHAQRTDAINKYDTRKGEII